MALRGSQEINRVLGKLKDITLLGPSGLANKKNNLFGILEYGCTHESGQTKNVGTHVNNVNSEIYTHEFYVKV